MKKSLTLVLALVLVMSLCAVAFAAVADNGNNSYTFGAANDSQGKDVTATVTPATPTYNIVVTFENMAFNYTMVWNPEDVADTNPEDAINDAITGHTYTGTLTSSTNNITVTNHSNVDVVAEFDWAQNTASTATGLTITMTDIADEELESASTFDGAYGHYDVADSCEVTVLLNVATNDTYSGNDLFKADAADNKIGTVTVTISAAA